MKLFLPSLVLFVCFALTTCCGCATAAVHPVSLAVAVESPDAVIYKIDGDYVGLRQTQIAPGVHEIELCKQAGFVFHSCVSQEVQLSAGNSYVIRVTGNVWDIEGLRVTWENTTQANTTPKD